MIKYDLEMICYRDLGFTLLELLVTLAIALLIACWGIPGFKQFYEKQQANHDVMQFFQALRLAQRLALYKHCFVTFCASDNQKTCHGQWRQGQILFINRDRHRQRQAGDQLLHVFGALSIPSEIHYRGRLSTPAITWDSSGQTNNNGTFQYIYDNRESLSRQLVLSNMGRVRLEKNGRL